MQWPKLYLLRIIQGLNAWSIDFIHLTKPEHIYLLRMGCGGENATVQPNQDGFWLNLFFFFGNRFWLNYTHLWIILYMRQENHRYINW